MQYEVGKTVDQSGVAGAPGQGVMPCRFCGVPAVFVCDFEVEPGRICDAPLCGRCRINFGLKDYCPAHAGLVRKEENPDGAGQSTENC